MATYTIELDDVYTSLAEQLAAFFKMPVEQMLRECAQEGLGRRETEMQNRQADPGGDAFKGYMRRVHGIGEKPKRKGKE